MEEKRVEEMKVSEILKRQLGVLAVRSFTERLTVYEVCSVSEKMISLADTIVKIESIEIIKKQNVKEVNIVKPI